MLKAPPEPTISISLLGPQLEHLRRAAFRLRVSPVRVLAMLMEKEAASRHLEKPADRPVARAKPGRVTRTLSFSAEERALIKERAWRCRLSRSAYAQFLIEDDRKHKRLAPLPENK